jgi:ABC-type sugar transport system ATPase subunit
MGREQLVEVRVGERALRVIAPASVPYPIGARVGVSFDPQRLHLFDAGSGGRLN